MINKLYDSLAEWWPLMSAPADYEEEATVYGAALAQIGKGPAETVLELGSGGGNNASWLKRQFRMTLVDPSPGMLAHSRKLNPECAHHEGDKARSSLRQTAFGKLFGLAPMKVGMMGPTEACVSLNGVGTRIPPTIPIWWTPRSRWDLFVGLKP